jgi:PAS domain S-box-containing protein
MPARVATILCGDPGWLVVVALRPGVPEALVGVDQSGMIRFINHQTESLFGYDRGHLIGQPIDTLVPEDLW